MNQPMREVYVVTAGQYSDYHIVAVFDNRDVAERCAKEIKGYAEIWELNSEEPKLDLYRVYMSRDGAATYVVNHGKWGKEWDEVINTHSYGGYKYFDIRAKDTEHAVKIANERRVREIAERGK